MLSPDSHPKSQRLNIGPWRIDLRRETVEAHDGPTGLTPRVESLLLLLCRSANTLVTHEQIFEEVWAGRVVEDAAISNCVWLIRKGLGDTRKEILQTRAKRGYVMVVPAEAWIDDTVGDEHAASSEHAVQPGHALSRSQRYSRHLRFAVLVVVLALCAGLAWRWNRTTATVPAIALTPDAEMSVAVIVPDALEWLRTAVLRTAVEAAYSRSSDVVVFQEAQRRNPFAGAHLQVRVVPAGKGNIDADVSLSKAKVAIRERYRGPADGLSLTVKRLLDRSFGEPPSPAHQQPIDALVSGRVAELSFDNLGALAQYRRALARDPQSVQAKLATARVLHAQGRGRKALALLLTLGSDASLTSMQQCDMNMLLLALDAERLRQPLCPLAIAQTKFEALALRDSLRQIDRDNNPSKGAQQWLGEEMIAITALTQLREWPQAEARVARMQRVADEAGWAHARIEIGTQLALIAINRGRPQDGARLRMQSADAMQALGDSGFADTQRIYALFITPVVPGPLVSERRQFLRHIIDEARRVGNLSTEVGGLQLLARLDRDNVPLWSASMDRVQRLIASEYTQGNVEQQMMLDEYRIQSRYRYVLAAISALEKTPTKAAYADTWNQTLKIRALFASDEIQHAVAAVDAIDKKNFDIDDTGDECLISWLFVEANRNDRARESLKRCQASEYDRTSQASRGDHGIFALARLYQLNGEAERAWPVVRPRIDALLKMPELTGHEAVSLAFLARHATSMPGADLHRLNQALEITTTMAARDGAGPRLRLGTHLLRWRLCVAATRTDCGPTLPEWAQEELLELRLAREAVTAAR